MKKQKGKKKAFLAVLLSAAVICQTFPAYSLAAQGPDGICPHHTEHTAECGYREAAAEVPCNHQHTEECYKTETNCLHPCVQRGKRLHYKERSLYPCAGK